MAADPFYQHLKKHYTWHVVGQFAAIFLLGGWQALVWAGCLRTVWVYHITWFVNSAAHAWGYQDYRTGELSCGELSCAAWAGGACWWGLLPGRGRAAWCLADALVTMMMAHTCGSSRAAARPAIRTATACSCAAG